MRDFSWKYFMITGDVDAYMLFKEMRNEQAKDRQYEDQDMLAEDQSDDYELQ